jgi:hypothetical protein
MMSTTRPRRSPRLRRSLVWFAALAVVLGSGAVALVATGQVGSFSLSPENLSLPPIDLSQIGGAFERGELQMELLLIGAAVALAVGIALPLLGAAVSRRRRTTARADAVQADLTDQPLEMRTTLPWPIEDAPSHQPIGVPSPQGFDLDPSIARPWNASLDAAGAEALAALEAAADPVILTPEIDAIQAAWWPDEPSSSPEVARHLVPSASTSGTGLSMAAETLVRSESNNGTDPAWHPTETQIATAGSVAIAPARAPHPADARPARLGIGSAEAPLVVELREEREGTRIAPDLLPRVAAIGTVAVGISFSAGSAVGATLGVGVGAAIGLAFAGGAGAAIGAAVALLGGRRS